MALFNVNGGNSLAKKARGPMNYNVGFSFKAATSNHKPNTGFNKLFFPSNGKGFSSSIDMARVVDDFEPLPFDPNEVVNEEEMKEAEETKEEAVTVEDFLFGLERIDEYREILHHNAKYPGNEKSTSNIIRARKQDEHPSFAYNKKLFEGSQRADAGEKEEQTVDFVEGKRKRKIAAVLAAVENEKKAPENKQKENEEFLDFVEGGRKPKDVPQRNEEQEENSGNETEDSGFAEASRNNNKG
ncbi:hypothetical protein RFI_06316, partial [Reticulomyxa filosa]